MSDASHAVSLADVIMDQHTSFPLRLFVAPSAVVDCFYYDTDLRDRWCSEALKWACSAHCRHCASRSHQARRAGRGGMASRTTKLCLFLLSIDSLFLLSITTTSQVFTALRPALSPASNSAMLACLHKCMQSANMLSLDTAVEVCVLGNCLQKGGCLLGTRTNCFFLRRRFFAHCAHSKQDWMHPRSFFSLSCCWSALRCLTAA